MTRPETWWNRQAGGREVLRVAMPLVISSLSWTVMTFVDRMMLRWQSGEAMTAAFSAGVLWFNTLCLPWGVCLIANTFVAQYFGSGNPAGVGRSVWQAIWIAVGFTVPCALLSLAGPWLIGLAGHEAEIARQEEIYFRILCYGSGGMLISSAAAAFFGGQGRTRVVMWVDGFFAGLNVVLDWFWIFGHAGFPAMGIAGAAWATTVSLWLKALTYLWLMLRKREDDQFQTRQMWRPDWELMRRMLRFGGPAGMQMFIDVLGFAVFIMLLTRLGKVSAEATTMAFGISSFAFMPVHGFGQTAGILVGQHLGEDRTGLAERAAWTAAVLGIGYMALVSLAYLAVPEFFLAGYFAMGEQRDPARDGEVRALAVILLRFVAAYNVFDAMFMVFAGALKGAGDTRFILWTSLVLAIALAGLSYLAVEVWKSDVFACWYLITGWVLVAGVAFMFRFMAGHWREMRVIESPPAAK